MADKAEGMYDAEDRTPWLELIEGAAGTGIKVIQDESLDESARLNIALLLFKEIQREFGHFEEEGVGGACVECTLQRNACLRDPSTNHAQCWEDFYSCTTIHCR